MEKTVLAGRELDALIAQRVFGIRVERSTHPSDEGEFYNLDRMRPGDNWPTVEIEHYSTDIAAAWKVVLSPACEGGHKFQFVCEHDVWTASVSGLHEADAGTAPLAICLAALKSLTMAETT